MNLVEVTRFNMVMDTVVGNPAEYATVLSGFSSIDYEVEVCASILSTVLGGLAFSCLSSDSEGTRLAVLDSLAGALQTRGAGYDRVVGETLGAAVAKRRLALAGRRIKVVEWMKLIRRIA